MLNDTQALQAWFVEAGKFLGLKQEICYFPDEVLGDLLEDDGAMISLYNADTSGAVLDFLHHAFEIRKGKDFLDKCPRIFESAMSLEDLEKMDPSGMEIQ